MEGAVPFAKAYQPQTMTLNEKFIQAAQLPTYQQLRLIYRRFGRNLCARLCARIEKSTYID